ncbi:MAG: amidohydrolase [Desulfobacterales bacterium]|nr:amidohydrolase [Desulfobacterales bacterium]
MMSSTRRMMEEEITACSVIDSHAHCGIQDRSFSQSFESYLGRIRGSEIEGVVMFPPVMEIYDRHDPDFEDDREWQGRRRRANDYLLSLHHPDLKVIPYFFIWNDFAVEDLNPRHRGIKWHRHPEEPVYRYGEPRCAEAIDEIRRRKLPILLEEELANTVRFIRELAVGIRVIIPHLGGLNGGYDAISSHGLWEEPNVWADTALAQAYEIRDYIERYGHKRLMFGSDFPFGDPKRELLKIKSLPISSKEKEALLGGNLKRLLATTFLSSL